MIPIDYSRALLFICQGKLILIIKLLQVSGIHLITWPQVFRFVIQIKSSVVQ